MRGTSRNGQRETRIRENVRSHYAEVAEGKTCCGDSGPSERIGYSVADLGSLPEGANLGLGCGNPTALASVPKGSVVVDLGSGAGIDAFLAAKKVGRHGRVIGVDMTPEMVSKARRNAEAGRYANVEFRLGEIEHLPVGDACVDLVVSNCVINLAPNKSKVYAEAFRVLRPGGRFAFSDVVATRPIPASAREDRALWSSCASGAISVARMRRSLERAGFVEIRVTVRGPTDEADAPGGERALGVFPADVTARKPGRSRAL